MKCFHIEIKKTLMMTLCLTSKVYLKSLNVPHWKHFNLPFFSYPLMYNFVFCWLTSRNKWFVESNNSSPKYDCFKHITPCWNNEPKHFFLIFEKEKIKYFLKVIKSHMQRTSTIQNMKISITSEFCIQQLAITQFCLLYVPVLYPA